MGTFAPNPTQNNNIIVYSLYGFDLNPEVQLNYERKMNLAFWKERVVTEKKKKKKI